MDIQIQETYNDAKELVGVELRSEKSHLSIIKVGVGVSILNKKSAMAKAWNSIGKWFPNWKLAIENYKKEETKSFVRKAKELFDATGIYDKE